jgi:uncharacterized membrane protein YfcA
MVGFGGGSSYNALLVLFNVDHHIYPSIALLCNIIVVTGGCWLFIKRGFLSPRLLLPFVITSIPMAHFTGRLIIDKTVFLMVLSIALFISGLIMIFHKHLQEKVVAPELNDNLWRWGLPIGACLGSLAGLVGIGGGIFLSPILYFLGWGTAKQIAATASGFIFVNSLAGISGQYFKLQESPSELNQLIEFWPVFIAVFVGGQIGSRLSSTRLSPQVIQQLTAVLVLYVSLRIGWILIQS